MGGEVEAVGDYFVVGALEFAWGSDVEADDVGLGLVGHVRGFELEGDGEADGIGGLEGFVDGVGLGFFGGWDVPVGEEGFGGVFGEGGGAGGEGWAPAAREQEGGLGQEGGLE